MTRLTLRGLAGRKLRALLTALAVVIGVSMVSGSYVLTDGIKKAFDGIFAESYDGTDAVINGKHLVEFSSSGRATVSAEVLAAVRALPQVEAAAGSIFDLQSNSNPATLIDENGKAIGGAGGAPKLGVGLDPAEPRFSPLELVSGDWARGPEQVVIDANTASDRGYVVGDRVGVAALGPATSYTITGIARFGSVDSLGGATIAVFDLATAQKLYGKDATFDAISIAASDGVTQQELVEQIRPLLPASAEVTTGDAQAAADSKETSDDLNFLTYFLLGFGAISLFVGAFVIFNTLSITVAQRTREFATVRTLGGSRRQVLRSVVLEGLVIGLVASVLGVLLGLGLAKAMNALFVGFGVDLPQAGTVLATRTIVLSLLVGTVVTVLASLIPAVRATRVAPISAVREGSPPPRSRLAPYAPHAALALLAIAIAALLAGLFAAESTTSIMLLVGVGVLALFVGVILVGSRLVRPLTALVGWPAARIAGSPGRLARENCQRNPARTAATAAALMIGLALITVVAVLGAGLRDSANNAVEKQITADYVVTSENGFDPFPASADDAITSTRGVALTSSVRYDRARAAGAETELTGLDPATITRFYTFDWDDGSDQTANTLTDDEAIVTRGFADDHDLALGSPLAVQTPTGATVELVVAGIYDPPVLDPMLGQISISQHAFDATFPRPRNLFTFVRAENGESSATTSALRQAITAFPDARLHTETGFVTSRTSEFSNILKLLYVLLAFSVLVSLFGMVNTLVLSVFERTRELGMLRAVGMTRRQARQLIRHESVITALIGATLGIGLGIGLSALVTEALRQYGVEFSLPIVLLVVFVLVAIAAGIGAAILPATRAARLNVLRALQYE